MIVPMGIHGQDDWVTLRRFIGYPFHSVHNIPVVTFPEVILSLAEAHSRVGNFDMGAYYLSQITLPRRKAEVTGAEISGNLAAGEPVVVLNERRRELMLMGHNYWDFFRRSRHLTNRQTLGSNDDIVNVTFGDFGIPNTLSGITAGQNWRAVYPIPHAEMTANPAIRGQQNPGYFPFTAGGDEE